MTWDWRAEFRKQFGSLPGEGPREAGQTAGPAKKIEAAPPAAVEVPLPPVEPDVDQVTGETEEGAPKSRLCVDCLMKPPAVLESVRIRGDRWLRVQCVTCGRTWRRHNVGGAA